ncbi:MAG TPA: glycosyltransferase [Candidatus Deferrimicrobiaceae bacterium]|jgi:glycosyltransferase involved in cell wall biosynthesis
MILHVVEPTFESSAGHCRSFVESLCRASAGRGVSIHIWAGRGAEFSAPEGVDVTLHRHFFRRLRRVQSFFLYRKLLKGPGRLFVSTAGRIDMALVTLAAGGTLPPKKAYLYFHWLWASPKKLAFFRETALRQPELVILAPIPPVVEPFKECGFRNVRMVPYPVAPAGGSEKPAGPFRHLLFAGAARKDKGFEHIVALIGRLKELGETVPFVVQTSADHYGKEDPFIRELFVRLKAIGYPGLRTVPETLSSEEYAKLFAGAICIQPYDRATFAGRVSGVTFDALAAGAPIVVPDGTWNAQAAEAHGAGVVVTDLGPEALLAAVQTIRADYAGYRDRAWEGGRRMQQSNGSARLLEALVE